MITSLYIHWPFCESKCPYCDFNSHVREKIEFDRWQNSYLKEIDFYKNKLGNKKIDSIFFGGGTPSLMKPEMIENILKKVRDEFIVKDDIEITLEANPSSFEAAKFRDFKAAGINRVSIGVQSFDEAALKFLGRRHDKTQAINAIEQAGKIFGNFSFDLIYALPSQTLESWNRELDFALKFGSPHISLYQLTIEKGTPFYADYHNGKFKLPSEELQTELYLATVEKCREKGLMRYEVSNFAKPGFESQHNLNYWLQNDYIGIGPGAHGRVHEGTVKVATMDIHNPENWLEAMEQKGDSTQSKEPLSQKEILEELIFMGLRIREGIKLEKFSVLGFKFSETFDQCLIKKLCDEGLMMVDNERVRLTDEGLLLHTSIVKKLLES
jgi:putative oxygen-independent coproporphyrinogen III oxidase